MGRPHRDHRWPALVLLLTIGGGCVGADGAGPTATIRDSAGVRIIEIAGKDVAPTWGAVHVADLIPPDSVLPATPWGVAADPSVGRIFVADRQTARLVVFDASGNYLGELGRAGGGPGEFRNPSALDLGADGLLRVWDTGRGIISKWSVAGEFLGEEEAGLPYWGPGFAADSNRLVTVTGRQADEGMRLDQRLLLSRDGRRWTLYELPLPMRMMRLPCVQRPAQTVFAPTLVWTSRGASTYVHRNPDYRVDIFEDTTLVASIRRSVPPISVTEEMAAEAVEFGPTPYRSLLRMCNVTPEQVVRAVGHEERVSPIMALAVDPEGGLWVTRTEDGISPSSIDVFDANAAYRFTLDVPGAVVGFPSGSTFLTLRMDRETGQTALSLYSIGGPVAVSESGSAGAPTADRSQEGAGPEPPAVEATWSPPPPDAELEPGDEFRDCPGCPTLVVLPRGRFLMGSPEGEAVDELSENWHHLLQFEKPQVEVNIGYPLAMGKYEVTFAEWDRCVEAGGCSHDPDDEGFGRGDRPVLNVNRLQAEEYLRWLSKETGHHYRLPSEAEWEYAARAGTTTARHWGDEIGEGMAACVGCGGRWNGRSTAPVGSFPANDFGLHDMLGNAYEWVSDCYTRGHDGSPSDGSPRLEESPFWEDGTCTVHVRRGGSWASPAWEVRAARRKAINTRGPWGFAGDRYAGFRVVRELKPSGSGVYGSQSGSVREGGGL